MKTYLSILFIILSFTTSFSQTREWKSINVPAHDNCYGLLNYEIQRRQTLTNPELYEARIIFTTGQFDNDFEFSFKGRKEGSWGRITVPAKGRKIVEIYGTYKLSESIYFDTERLRYLGLELKHLRGEEQYVKCGEGANEVLRRDEAKGKMKANNTSEEVGEEEEMNTKETENKDYQVLDVNTSVYEAEKERKRQQAELKNQEKTDKERKDKEYQDRKDAFEKEQLAKLNRSNQAYEQRQTNLTNTGNKVLNALDNISQQADARRVKENAANDERYRQIEADRKAEAERRAFEYKEEQLRKQRERDAKIAKEERIVFLRNSRNAFVKNIENQNIPIQVSTREVFFFMVNTEGYGKEIIFAPFKVLADENKQIPYGNEMIQDFRIKTGEYGYKIYGPYNSKYEQENAIKKMADEASRIEIIRKDDIEYEYIQKKKTSDESSDTDFWGENKDNKPKPKEPTEKKKKATSFWDN